MLKSVQEISTILLADDHELFRIGLQHLLQSQLPKVKIFTASDGLEALEITRAENPEVIITDFDMPQLNGLEFSKKILAEQPDARIICLSMHQDAVFAQEMLKIGCLGYLIKDSTTDELILALSAIVKREKYISYKVANQLIETQSNLLQNTNLSVQELKITKMLCEGNSNKEIGFELGISVRTVESHRSNIFSKLKVHNLAELIRFSLKKGIISLE
ncbi:MAG: response regulator transcription factor [SAR324 cluster bacterium]|nr:response regulator transcription factor [SAR324 cluster bacterium]